jgi:parallel beta-helix repeat protein
MVFLINPIFAQLDFSNGIKENSKNNFVDKSGYVHVIGEIQNKQSRTVEFLKVNVAYYDSRNQIVGTDSVYSVPSTILPGQTATFEVLTSPESLASTDTTSIKVKYEYQVDGQTYVSEGLESFVQSKLSPAHGESLVPDNSIPSIPPCLGVLTNESYILDRDVECNSDGLIVGTGNVVINLNGHTIDGSGIDSQRVGIAVPHNKNVMIKGPGTIKNFQAGILITGSEKTQIGGIKFEANKIGIFMTGSMGSVVENNNITNNTIGIASHSSTEASLSGNNIIKNELAGITLVKTDTSELFANNVSGSRNGIFLDAQSGLNNIFNNTASRNDIDINNSDGLSLKFNGNQVLNNTCAVSQPAGSCSFPN